MTLKLPPLMREMNELKLDCPRVQPTKIKRSYNELYINLKFHICHIAQWEKILMSGWQIESLYNVF